MYILNAMPLNYENLDSSDLYSIKISGPEAGSVHRPCERTGLEAGFDTSPRARYSSFCHLGKIILILRVDIYCYNVFS